MNDQTLWAMAQLYIARDLSVPIDLLAEADSRGCSSRSLDQPRNPHEEGEDYGRIAKEELYDATGHAGLCVSDYPDTAFDAAGVYKTDFKLMPDAAKPLLDDMRAVAKEAFGDDAAKIALPYKTDEETGELTFKTKSKYQPRFVDASGKGVDPGSMPVVRRQ